MKNQKPLISVILSVYNGINYIERAIKGILSQTYKNFEFIIIDDNSNDGTNIIIKKYEDKDVRIIVIKNSLNLGLTKSLNIAINKSKGKYIARQDVDECSLPERLEYQLNFMTENNAVVVGSNCINIYPDGTKTVWGYYNEFQILKLIKFRSPIPHGSAFFDKNIFFNVNRYDEKYQTSQDLDLWIKMSNFGKIIMSKKILLHRNIDINSISERRKFKQFTDSFIIRINHSRGLERLILILYSFYYYFISLIPKKIFFLIINFKKKLLFSK